MGSSVGRGLVVALETEEGDLVADGVVVGVDTELVETLGTLEATSLLVLTVDDLVRGGQDGVGGGEVVGLAATETELEVKVEVEVQVEVEAEETTLLAVLLVTTEVEEGAGLGGGSEGDSGDGSGLHCEGCGCWLVWKRKGAWLKCLMGMLDDQKNQKLGDGKEDFIMSIRLRWSVGRPQAPTRTS